MGLPFSPQPPAKLAFWAWHDFCQARFMLSKIVGIRIFRELSRALDLRLPLAVEAEWIDSHTIFLGIDFRLDPAAQLLELLGVQSALEDGILHPLSKVF